MFGKRCARVLPGLPYWRSFALSIALIVASMILWAAFGDPRSMEMSPKLAGLSFAGLLIVIPGLFLAESRFPKKRHRSRALRHFGVLLFVVAMLAGNGQAETSFTWQQVRDKFETAKVIR